MRWGERTFAKNGWLFRVWTRMPVFWRFQLVGWAAFIALTLPVKASLSGDLITLVASFAVRDGLSFGLTLLMRALYDWVYRNHRKSTWIAGSIVAASVTGGFFQLVVFYFLGRVLPFEEMTIFGQSVALGIFYYRTGLFIFWSLLYFGIRQMRDGMERDLRLTRIEAEKRGAELQMLRAQMNPHFLFNALTTIQVGISHPGTYLQDVVQALADYLRYSLDHREQDQVPLGEEFDAIVAYLAVEKARFREELEIDIHMDEVVRTTLVPGILLQPLVENAIKYGHKTSPLPLRVKLLVSRSPADRIRIEVANTGEWTAPEERGSLGGVGLGNLRRRLELIYPGTHDLEISAADGWVTVRLELPMPA